MEDSAGAQIALTEFIHLPSVVQVLLNTLHLSDLAHLAVSSKACAAVLRPDNIQLDINRAFELPALRCLFRLGCLDQLYEATVCASHGDATAGSYLGILGMCPRLRQLSVDYTVEYESLEEDDQSFRGLAAGLPIHLTRNVHLVGLESAQARKRAAKLVAYAPSRFQMGPCCVKHFNQTWQPTQTAVLPAKYW